MARSWFVSRACIPIISLRRAGGWRDEDEARERVVAGFMPARVAPFSTGGGTGGTNTDTSLVSIFDGQ